MTTYTSVIKLDSLPSFEPTTGYIPAIKLDPLPSFGPKLGTRPAVRIVLFGDDRPRSGQLYPRGL